MTLIYLASPYSHASGDVRGKRHLSACLTAAKLTSEGRFVFSPVAHSHYIAESGTITVDDPYWYELGFAMLKRCDELWILMLDGWKESKGIAAELAIAVERGMPVRYIEP